MVCGQTRGAGEGSIRDSRIGEADVLPPSSSSSSFIPSPELHIRAPFFSFPLERSDVSRLPLPPVARRPKLQRPQLRMLLAACVRTTTAHACMLFNGQLALQVGSGGSEKRRHFSFCVFFEISGWLARWGKRGQASGMPQLAHSFTLMGVLSARRDRARLKQNSTQKSNAVTDSETHTGNTLHAEYSVHP